MNSTTPDERIYAAPGEPEDLRRAYGEIYVVTGAIFDRDGDGQRDPDEDAPHTKAGSSVAVPTHFYKIIAFEVSDTEIELMCFVLNQSVLSPPKNARDGFLNDAMVDLDLIEKATGVDFFPDFDGRTGAAFITFDEMWPF